MTTTAAMKQALGAYGEDVAVRHLVERQMTVLDRNWRSPGDPVGEIDVVLRDGDVLVVCEVKTRSNDDHGTPHEAIGEAKLERLRRLGWRWALEHGATPPETRVDLVAVRRPPRGPAVVEHVPGVG
jgi:putative endonuclease